MGFHFLRLYWFFALIPALLLLFRIRHRLSSKTAWQQLVDAPLLNRLLVTRDAKPQYVPVILFGLIWLTAIIALAGPSWKKWDLPLYQNQDAKIILLDLSTSMLTNDIAPNRLTRATYKVLDILNHFPDGQTGMAVFSAEAYTVAPLTNDTHTISLMVPKLSPSIMPVSGNNINVGLQQALKLLLQSRVNTGNILLITDSSPSAAALSTAAAIHNLGFNISVLALGNIRSLKQLALTGGGRFSTFTNTDADIDYLLAPTENPTEMQLAKQRYQGNLWIDEGRWLILLIIPFMLFSFRRAGFLDGLS